MFLLSHLAFVILYNFIGISKLCSPFLKYQMKFVEFDYLYHYLYLSNLLFYPSKYCLQLKVVMNNFINLLIFLNIFNSIFEDWSIIHLKLHCSFVKFRLGQQKQLFHFLIHLNRITTHLFQLVIFIFQYFFNLMNFSMLPRLCLNLIFLISYLSVKI